MRPLQRILLTVWNLWSHFWTGLCWGFFVLFFSSPPPKHWCLELKNQIAGIANKLQIEGVNVRISFTGFWLFHSSYIPKWRVLFTVVWEFSTSEHFYGGIKQAISTNKTSHKHEEGRNLVWNGWGFSPVKKQHVVYVYIMPQLWTQFICRSVIMAMGHILVSLSL